MTERSDYQKLRAHLAFLRMGAAAEALPGLLDEAIATKCSTQAFLEKLLSVEVDAVEERRRVTLERFASLPSPFTLSDFDFSAQPSLDEKLVRELGTLRFVEDATNVLFIEPLRVERTRRRQRRSGHHPQIGLGHLHTFFLPQDRRWHLTMTALSLNVADPSQGRKVPASRSDPAPGTCATSRFLEGSDQLGEAFVTAVFGGSGAELAEDEIWDEAARHYDEPQLAALVIAIAAINAFNRVNVATRQPTGDHVARVVEAERAG
ncbi:MAG: ATP-binding protein, partial [Actinomycetes bacterium]